MNLWSEDREAVMRRMTELKARVDALRLQLNSTTISEWVAIDKEHETLEQQLGDDS